MEFCQLYCPIATDNWPLLYIFAQAAAVFHKVAEKGLASPVTLSVNNCIACFAPLPTTPEDSELTLNVGDIVKIELAVHIDGYICAQGHTHVVVDAATSAVPRVGAPADAICAAHYAAEAVLRLLTPGRVSTEITSVIETIAQQFHCTPIAEIGSHTMRQHLLEGLSIIPSRTDPDNIVDPCVVKTGA